MIAAEISPRASSLDIFVGTGAEPVAVEEQVHLDKLLRSVEGSKTEVMRLRDAEPVVKGAWHGPNLVL